jgi:hypothetical protein
MPAQQQHTSYTGYTSASNGPITAGQCVVLDASGDYYNVSTTAARATAVRRSTGIAVTSCSGDAQDRGFEVQVVGEIDASITGLAAGTASLIRVSSTGVLERVASYSSSDDVVGFCDADGTAHVCFPLAGLNVAIGAGSAPGLPSRSIQYYLTSTTLGGAAHAGISTDGYIEHSADRTGGAATTGDARFAKASSLMARNYNGTRNVCVWQSSGSSLDRLIIGSQLADFGTRVTDFNEVYVQPRTIFLIRLLDQDDGGASQGFSVERYPSSNQAALGILARTNLGFSGGKSAIVLTDFGGGVGVQFWGDAATEPTTNPASGCVFWIKPSTHHLYQRLPDGTVVDLTAGAGGSEANYLAVTSQPAASIDVTGVGVLEYTGATSITLYGLTAPAAGAAKRVVISNFSSDSEAVVTIEFESGSASAAADGFANQTTTTIAKGESYIAFYSHASALWRLVRGAT